MSKKLKKSLQAQRAMASKVTEKMLEKELHRFTTMSKKQLLTRLNRITKPEKAEAMRIMAKWCEEWPLLRAACKRRNELVHS